MNSEQTLESSDCNQCSKSVKVIPLCQQVETDMESVDTVEKKDGTPVSSSRFRCTGFNVSSHRRGVSSRFYCR